MTYTFIFLSIYTYMSLCIHMYTYIYIYMYMCAYMYMYVNMYIYVNTCKSLSTYVCMYVCMSICLSVCLPACMYVCMYMYMYMYIYIYIYICDICRVRISRYAASNAKPGESRSGTYSIKYTRRRRKPLDGFRSSSFMMQITCSILHLQNWPLVGHRLLEPAPVTSVCWGCWGVNWQSKSNQEVKDWHSNIFKLKCKPAENSWLLKAWQNGWHIAP